MLLCCAGKSARSYETCARRSPTTRTTPLISTMALCTPELQTLSLSRCGISLFSRRMLTGEEQPGRLLVHRCAGRHRVRRWCVSFPPHAHLMELIMYSEKMNVSMLTEFDNEVLMSKSAKQCVSLVCLHSPPQPLNRAPRKLEGTHREKQSELRVPRRPRWTRTMPGDVLEQMERDRCVCVLVRTP